jgi:flagellar hook-associated protein 3 FlgL
MANRVASNAAIGRIGGDLARSMQRFSQVQQQIASGKRLTRPSDDPGAVADALKGRATQRQVEQYTTNATDAVGWLGLTDTTLSSVQDSLRAAKSLMVSANSGAMDPTGREAIANELEGNRAGVLQLANTSYLGRSIFAGTAATGAPPYSSSGAYSGDAGAVNRTIADGVTLKVNVNGPSLFGTADPASPLDGDVFQVMDAMAAAVRSGDQTKMAAAGAALDKAINRLDGGQVKVGSVTNQVEQTVGRNELLMLDVKERLSQVEDIDLAQSIIELKTSENAYQAALGVTAKIIQPSLMDFLR